MRFNAPFVEALRNKEGKKREKKKKGKRKPDLAIRVHFDAPFVGARAKLSGKVPVDAVVPHAYWWIAH